MGLFIWCSSSSRPPDSWLGSSPPVSAPWTAPSPWRSPCAMSGVASGSYRTALAGLGTQTRCASADTLSRFSGEQSRDQPPQALVHLCKKKEKQQKQNDVLFMTVHLYWLHKQCSHQKNKPFARCQCTQTHECQIMCKVYLYPRYFLM